MKAELSQKTRVHRNKCVVLDLQSVENDNSITQVIKMDVGLQDAQDMSNPLLAENRLLKDAIE